MHLGKARPKIAMSFSTFSTERLGYAAHRIRLGVAGTPSSWTAPTKDQHVDHAKKKRR